MGPLVTAMKRRGQRYVSWLLMGMPGLAYRQSIASPGWTAIGLALNYLAMKRSRMWGIPK